MLGLAHVLWSWSAIEINYLLTYNSWAQYDTVHVFYGRIYTVCELVVVQSQRLKSAGRNAKLVCITYDGERNTTCSEGVDGFISIQWA